MSMGNPHAVVYESNGNDLKLTDVDLFKVGPLFEKYSEFPAKINTEFVEVVNSSTVNMVVWERGAGRTLACGTGK